ncbi:MAG: CocE/NonD family hydrolase [Acidobacteriota bacterium]
MRRKLGLAALAILLPLLGSLLFNVLRHLVFWSPSEEVVFESGEIRLAGTLVKPAEEGSFPAVLMLHGSGPEPRSDPPTRAVMNTLVRHGFAVLAYDKRGVDASGGDFKSASYGDFIDDALAALDYLAARDDIDGTRLGLYCVSESGWFGPEIASRSQSVDFIFNKVGPAVSWVETVSWEVRNDTLADGIAEEDVDQFVDLARRQWSYYRAVAADPSLLRGPEREAIEAEMVRIRAEVPGADRILGETLPEADLEAYQAFAAQASYDPTPYLRGLDIPLHYAYASEDINVPTDRCLAALTRLTDEQGKPITLTVYISVGHSLATWRGLLSAGFPPGYLDSVGTWASEQVGGTSRSSG